MARNFGSEPDPQTLTLAQARHMSVDELRSAFVEIVSDVVASHGFAFLPEGFPRGYRDLTAAGMLELIARHPNLFAPKELLARPAAAH